MGPNSYQAMTAAQPPFKVYPRGFLGAHLQERVQKEDKMQENNRGFVQVKVSAVRKTDGINGFSHAIQELYSAYIREAADAGSFDFRERVFRQAKQAFGTPWFDQWFQAQLTSPFVGALQRDFLDDTLDYLERGKRKMALENWAPLLEIANADEGLMQPSETAAKFFRLGKYRNGLNRALSVEDVIQSWCSIPNGFEDLLGTLHILFGAA